MQHIRVRSANLSLDGCNFLFFRFNDEKLNCKNRVNRFRHYCNLSLSHPNGGSTSLDFEQFLNIARTTSWPMQIN